MVFLSHLAGTLKIGRMQAMFEKVLHSDKEKAQSLLKTALARTKCKIVIESSESLTVIQGSVWGSTPETAMKRVRFSLTQDGEDTKIVSRSSLHSSWIILNIVFFAFAAFLIGSSWIIANDLEVSALANQKSSWDWLAAGLGFQTPENIVVFVAALRSAIFVIAVGMIAETLLTYYIFVHKECFAQKTIESLT